VLALARFARLRIANVTEGNACSRLLALLACASPLIGGRGRDSAAAARRPCRSLGGGEHRGKRGYWQTWRQIISDLHGDAQPWHRVLFLQDDFIPGPTALADLEEVGSSGVGAQITMYLHARGFTMWQTPEAWVRHSDLGRSIMHPQHRKEVPL
jgi:hypothetical protein